MVNDLTVKDDCKLAISNLLQNLFKITSNNLFKTAYFNKQTQDHIT